MKTASEKMPVSRLRELYKLNRETGDISLRHNGRLLQGRKNSHNRKSYTLQGRTYSAAEVVWALYSGEWPSNLVGFKNGNTLDLRPVNLRATTTALLRISRATPSTGIREVGGRWYGRLWRDGNTYSTGGYATKEEAIRARAEKEKELAQRNRRQ